MANKLIPYNPALKKLARQLRKTATPGERLLWKHTRREALGVEFHRQVPLHKYIVNFYCHELRLAVEIDGGSHDDHTAQDDMIRQKKLECLGVRFIRFSEHEVINRIEYVLTTLKGLITLMRCE